MSNTPISDAAEIKREYRPNYGKAKMVGDGTVSIDVARKLEKQNNIMRNALIVMASNEAPHCPKCGWYKYIVNKALDEECVIK